MNQRLFALSLLVIAACGSDVLGSTGYDKSCKVDTDCVDVYFGDLCDGCRCSNDAISASELDRYQKDVNAMPCRGRAVCTASCVFPPPVCNQGTCGLRATK